MDFNGFFQILSELNAALYTKFNAIFTSVVVNAALGCACCTGHWYTTKAERLQCAAYEQSSHTQLSVHRSEPAP